MIEAIKKYPEICLDAINLVEKIDIPDYKFDSGVLIYGANCCTISASTFHNNYCGVFLRHSSRNKVTRNEFVNSSFAAIMPLSSA